MHVLHTRVSTMQLADFTG